MNDNIKWRIPSSVLCGLLELPKDRPIAVLLRHSVCDDLPPGIAGYSLPITEAGTQLAQELGGLIGEGFVHSIQVHSRAVFKRQMR